MIKSVLAGFLITMLISCTAMKVTTDFDPSVDFSVFKTYRCAQLSADKPQGYSSDYKFLDARIREAVDKQLVTKGYAPRENRGQNIVFANILVTIRDNKPHGGDKCRANQDLSYLEFRNMLYNGVITASLVFTPNRIIGDTGMI
jgi:hypothetical protein